MNLKFKGRRVPGAGAGAGTMLGVNVLFPAPASFAANFGSQDKGTKKGKGGRREPEKRYALGLPEKHLTSSLPACQKNN